MTLAAVAVLAYLLGSLPFSFLVARAFGVSDVRKVGSGNVGATNVMRSAGKTAGLIAFVLDAVKGGVAASLAEHLAPGTGPLAAVLSVLGHMYPVWLRFEGGKGVATGAGAFLPLAPLAVGTALVAFPLTLLATRYVSVASLVGAWTLAAVAAFRRGPYAVTASVVVVAALITWKHRANLERLRAGTENRLGQRARPAPEA